MFFFYASVLLYSSYCCCGCSSSSSSPPPVVAAPSFEIYRTFSRFPRDEGEAVPPVRPLRPPPQRLQRHPLLRPAREHHHVPPEGVRQTRGGGAEGGRALPGPPLLPRRGEDGAVLPLAVAVDGERDGKRRVSAVVVQRRRWLHGQRTHLCRRSQTLPHKLQPLHEGEDLALGAEAIYFVLLTAAVILILLLLVAR